MVVVVELMNVKNIKKSLSNQRNLPNNIYGRKKVCLKLGDYNHFCHVEEIETFYIEKSQINHLKVNQSLHFYINHFFEQFGATYYCEQRIIAVRNLREFELYQARFKTGHNITITSKFGPLRIYYNNNPNVYLPLDFNVFGEKQVIHHFVNTYLKNIYNETKQPEILEYINKINKKIFLEV